MITTIDNFTKQILENLKPATKIFLAMARMEETQKPTLLAISSRLDSESTAGTIQKQDINLPFLPMQPVQILINTCYCVLTQFVKTWFIKKYGYT